MQWSSISSGKWLQINWEVIALELKLETTIHRCDMEVWMVEVSKWLKSGKFDLIVVGKSFDWIPADVQSSHEEGRCALMVFDWWIEGALWFQTIGYTDPDYWFLPDRWLDMLTCALPCSNELETNLLLYFQNTTPFKRKITIRQMQKQRKDNGHSMIVYAHMCYGLLWWTQT